MRLDTRRCRLALAAFTLAMSASIDARAQGLPAGFVPLFNGKDLAGWKVPAGDNGHWKVVDGVIDYDARSEAPGDKALWSEGEYGDFVLRVDWRIKETPFVNAQRPDRQARRHATRRTRTARRSRSPCPIPTRGSTSGGGHEAQVNIWCWPVGSGEVYGYRTKEGVSRRSAGRRDSEGQCRSRHRPVEQLRDHDARRPFDRGPERRHRHRRTPSCPSVPAKGTIALQHHGDWKDGAWVAPPALVQFRNIAIRELK